MDKLETLELEPEDMLVPEAGDDEGAVSFVDAQLFPSFTGEGNQYRTRNDPANPYQREGGTDRRKGPVSVRCTIRDVVHGILSEDDPTSYATLIVFGCSFYSRKHSSRVASADVELIFSGMGPQESGPEVVDIVPRGKFCLAPHTEHDRAGIAAEIGVGVPIVAGVQAGASVRWHKSRSRQVTKATTLVGETGLYGRDFGKDDGCAWTLLENPLTKDGIPESFQGAVLLRRKDAKSLFKCDLKLVVRTDRWSAISRMFASREIDDPILFDSSLPPTNRLKTYDPSNLALEQLSLGDLMQVSFLGVRSGFSTEDGERD